MTSSWAHRRRASGRGARGAFRTLLLAAPAAALLSAPAATAYHDRADCTFDLLPEPVTAPGTYEGFAVGYVVSAGDTPTVQCRLRIGGEVVAETPTSAATPTAAVTAGTLRFTTDAVFAVELCTVYTIRQTTMEACGNGPQPAFPPSWVWWPVDRAYYIVEHPLCATLRALRHVAVEPVHVDDEGDVYVDGEPMWDCRPPAAAVPAS